MKHTKNLKPQTVRERLDTLQKKGKVPVFNLEDTCQIGGMCIASYRKKYKQEPQKVREESFDVNVYPPEFVRIMDALIYHYFKKNYPDFIPANSSAQKPAHKEKKPVKKRKRIQKIQPVFTTKS